MLYHAIAAGHAAGVAFLAATLCGAPFLPSALLATGAALCTAAVSLAATVRA